MRKISYAIQRDVCVFIKNENTSNDWKQRAKMQIFVRACVCVCVCVYVSQNLLAEGMKTMVVNSTIRLFLGVF